MFFVYFQQKTLEGLRFIDALCHSSLLHIWFFSDVRLSRWIYVCQVLTLTCYHLKCILLPPPNQKKYFFNQISMHSSLYIVDSTNDVKTSFPLIQFQNKSKREIMLNSIRYMKNEPLNGESIMQIVPYGICLPLSYNWIDWPLSR